MISAESFSGTRAASYWPAAVAGNINLDYSGALPRWVCSESGGDLAVTFGDGSTGTIKLPKMVPVPVQLQAVTAAGSTAHTLLFVW